MEQHHRDIIDRVCEEILPIVDMKSLWPGLIEYGVYHNDDVNIPQWKLNMDHPDTVRDILLTIKTRGPYAFSNLIRSLHWAKQRNVSDILQRGMVPPFNNNTSTNENSQNGEPSDEISCKEWLDKVHNHFESSEEPIKMEVTKATQFLDEPEFRTLPKYRMRSKPRGYVLIITIISYKRKPYRRGAEHDGANLEKLFIDMGFEVSRETNLTAAQIKVVVREFSQKNFHNVDSSFVIISAHGEETERNGFPETEILGTDYDTDGAETLFANDIINLFAADVCNEHLNGKPKIFIFQACRGNNNQKMFPRHEADGSNANPLPRKFSDILVAYSTIPGHESYRDRYLGSWYLQVLCWVFMRYACNMHLVDLLSTVDGVMKHLRTADRATQTSVIHLMGFGQHCYLNPGLFEEDS